MDCHVIQDLIPLYIDGCCSEESKQIINEHIKHCDTCRKALSDMSAPSDVITVTHAPMKLQKLNDWKASILQSVLLFVSFFLITVGVSLEARSDMGLLNGFWAVNLVVPATGMLLSLTNWYFVRVYTCKKTFSNCCWLITLGITFLGYIWWAFHYDVKLLTLFSPEYFVSSLTFTGLGYLLTVVFCVSSKIFSQIYAEMLGKE